MGDMYGRKAAAKAQETSIYATKRFMKMRHQWEVEDLLKAGLNPILSAHAAPSMGSVPAPTVSGGPASMISSAADALSAAGKTRKITPEVKALKAQAAAGHATAAKQLEEGRKASTEEQFLDNSFQLRMKAAEADMWSAGSVANQNMMREEILANELPRIRALGQFYSTAKGIRSAQEAEAGANLFRPIKGIIGGGFTATHKTGGQ